MDGVLTFWKQPFSEDMDGFHWALFIGLVLIVVVFWNIILSHILGDMKKQLPELHRMGYAKGLEF